jgi:hypothetical protein
MRDFSDGPLDFSLSTKGLAVTGATSSPDELVAFIKTLNRLVAFLPSSTFDAKDKSNG